MPKWEYCVVFTTTTLELNNLTDEQLWKMVESLPEETPNGFSGDMTLYKTVSMRQYLVEERPTVIEDVGRTFTEMGSDGWELVTVTNTNLNATYVTTYYFKRPRE